MEKLLKLYPGAVLTNDFPQDPRDGFHIFLIKNGLWLSIPKDEISEKEMVLLSALYTYEESLFAEEDFSPSKNWKDFLYFNGPLPEQRDGNVVRIIHFIFNEDEFERLEFESALKGFFSDNVLLIWEHRNRGILIEEKNQFSLSEKELHTLSQTLEADFFTKVFFYTGKFLPISEKLVYSRKQESDYFSFARKFMSEEKVLSFEKIFPHYLAYHLPKELKDIVEEDLIALYREDDEMFSTIKVFLENNLNASVTAKKLYIHRNTLQYRIDKFTDRTGIQLKDFHVAFSVFVTCLLYELERQSEQ
jgi:hypothetical protein